MPKIIAALFFIILLGGCTRGLKGIFATKSPREKYAEKVQEKFGVAGLAWLRAGDSSLANPVTTPVPYAETGVFNGDSTDVISFMFTVPAGQKINVAFTPKNKDLNVFTELWELSNAGLPKLLATADTLSNSIMHPSPGGGRYVLRLQPQVNDTGIYRLIISGAPLLGFPIAENEKPRIGSVWGDNRDAGARRHEGIDIFAKKGSPVLAVEDGTVYRTDETSLGGKVIWLSPADYKFSIYYAHLDTQLVQAGARVRKGDLIGRVGNTGNARTTPAHLHFGIYTSAGALNPIHFIQLEKLPRQNELSQQLNSRYLLKSKATLYSSPETKDAIELTQNSRIIVKAVSENFYRVITDEGVSAFVLQRALTAKMKL